MPGKWSNRDMPDLSGRVALVTGACGGLGAVTTRDLAGAGAQVVMACRNADKAGRVVGAIRQDNPAVDIEVMALDLASLDSIRALADRFNTVHDRLDILVNNAGVIGLPERRTQDGFEMHFGVNHLGHFALTGLLLDSLRHSGAARVVAVGSSSGFHRFGRIRLDDPNWEQGRYRRFAATLQGKLALRMTSWELHSRLQAGGESVISVAAHPGVAQTDISLVGAQMRGARLEKRLMEVGNKLFVQSADQGALPTLYAATALDVKGGEFFGPGGLLELGGYPERVKTAKNVQDRQLAGKLWTLSEQLTGVRYLSV